MYYGIRSQYSVIIIIEVLNIYWAILKNIFFLFHISVYTLLYDRMHDVLLSIIL